MKNLFLLVTIIGACGLVGCMGKVKACDTKRTDSDWEVIGKGGLRPRLAQFLKSPRNIVAARTILGPAQQETRLERGVSLSWASGSRRSGQTFRCGKLVEQTYHVSYMVPIINFTGDTMHSCEVTLKEYIGPMSNPNPFLDKPLLVKNMSCESALDESE